jgi:hypothetical protein
MTAMHLIFVIVFTATIVDYTQAYRTAIDAADGKIIKEKRRGHFNAYRFKKYGVQAIKMDVLNRLNNYMFLSKRRSSHELI